jgi:uncharacterized protein YjbJ (UPF0337 family)
MSSLAQYSRWHKAYAGFKGAVKESAGEIFGDKKLRLKAKPTSNMQKGSRRIEGCGVQK